MAYSRAGRALGEPPNRLRVRHPHRDGAAAGWDGARRPVIWTVPPPEIEPGEARLELARRYLRVFGPGTRGVQLGGRGLPGRWARRPSGALGKSLIPVATPIGEAWVLTRDEAALRSAPGPVAPARLLPSGDAYFLLQGADREVLVPDTRRRGALWTSSGVAGRGPRREARWPGRGGGRRTR